MHDSSIKKIIKIFWLTSLLIFLTVTFFPLSGHCKNKVKINKKPKKYGVYLYRNKKFISLSKTSVHYSGISYSTDSSNRGVGACYVSTQAVNSVQTYGHNDLIVIYFPDVKNRNWNYAPLSYYPDATFEGDIEAEIDHRPEGYYAGLVAIGGGLHKIVEGYHSHGYHLEQKSIGYKDIVYSEQNIIFAKIWPSYNIPLEKYIITNNGVVFYDGEASEQLPHDGYIVEFPAIKNQKNYIAKKDRLKRFNENNSKKYLIAEKEFELGQGEIINTGIFVFDTSYVRFISERNFRLVLKYGEWDNNGFRPFRGDFRENYKVLKNSKDKAHRVQFRDFALRYQDTKNGTEVKLQGIKGGSKVKVIYSPLYCNDKIYSNHIKSGWKLFEKGDFESANREFKTALEKFPDHFAAYNGLAWLYSTAKNKKYRNPKLAMDYAKKLLKFRPERSSALDTVSEAYFVNGDLKNAIKYENKAYGDWYTKPKHYNEKMQKYNSIKEHLNRAHEHEQDEMYEEAIKELKLALKKLPNYFDAFNSLAWLYATAKDESIKNPSLALEYATKAYELAPTKANILDTFAEAHYANGNTKQAIEFEEKAIYWDPVNEFYEKQIKRFQGK